MLSALDFTAALRGLGVRSDDVLFVHSDVRRCLRAEGRTREEKFATILGGLDAAVAGGTLMLPTFTYSFCEGEDFDRAASPSTVGVLSEAFRHRPGVRRTADPLFSCAVRGPLPDAWERRLMTPAATSDAFGPESVFAFLVEADARIALLGVDATMATLVHHVEQLERVPYRYPKAFHGTIRDGATATAATVTYLVRDLEADAENLLDPLVDELRREGVLAETRLDRGPELSVVGARDLVAVTSARLREDPEFLLARRHREAVA